MADCTRCPCGQVLDPDERWPDCPACGRATSSPAARPDRAGLGVVLTVAGFLIAVTVGWFTISLAKRFLPPPTVPRQEVAVAVEPLPPPPPVDPVVAPPVPPKVEPPPPPPIAPRVEKPPEPTGRMGVIESAVVPPPGGYKVGEVVQQDLVVTRRSTFRVLGLEVSRGAQYALSSRVVVTAVGADGSLVADQTVTAARLLDADPDARADFTAALEKVPGTKFKLAVGPTGDAMAVKGFANPVRVKPGMQGEFQSLLVCSVMDGDGWKEVAGLMFFQPAEPLKAGAKWGKPVTHDWGPLGSWAGKTNFVARGKAVKSPLDRIDYAHALDYRPPAAGAANELPFRVTKAEFKAVAGGAILYDSARGRGTAAEETFYVRGGLVASVAGPDVPIEMEERQNFKLSFGESTSGNLVGKPPKK